MRFKGKFLIVAILCMFAVVKLSSLSAVGNVYQAIADYGTADGKPQLVYRTVVRPSEATLNLFNNYNKWETDEKITDSAWKTYRTKYLIFTKKMIGKYVENSNVNVGYATFDINEKGYDAFLSNDAASVTTWFNNASNKHVKYVKVTDNFGSYFYQYSYQNATTSEVTNQNLSKSAFDKYNDNTIDAGREIILSPLFSAKSPEIIKDKKYVKPITNNYSIKGVVDWKTYRSMLYTTKYSGKPDTDDDTAKIFYISDILLDSTTTSKLTAYYNSTGNDPYVSAITSTNSKYSGGEEFYALTPGAFIHSKLRGIGDGTGWSRPTLGIENDGMSSGLNLWDNILKLPTVTDNTKTILVNNIAVDIDANGNKTYSLISTSEETVSIGNNKNTLYDINNAYLASDGTITTTSTSKPVLVSKEQLSNRGIQYALRVGNSSTVFKVSKLNNLSTDYIYVGHTADLLKTSDTITNTYYAVKYSSKVSGEPTITLTSDINALVINMYYESKAKEITVQYNVCDDMVNYTGCVAIEGNRELVLTYGNATSTVKWTGADNIETYYVNEKYDISASKVESTNYEYEGYIVKYGNTKSELTNTNTCRVKAQDSGSNAVVITFYYSKKGNSTITAQEKPNIDISGTLTLQSAVGISTTCKEYYSVPTNAKDGTSDVYVGIKNTPMYVLAGIDVEEQKKENQLVTINVTISFGPYSKVWKIEVPYSLSYYAIQDLLIYKYQSAEIYDAGSANTSGETLFNQSTLSISPKSTLNSKLTLYTFINSNMSYADNMNWKNYLTVKYSLDSMIDNTYNAGTGTRDEIENGYARTLSNSNVINIISSVPNAQEVTLKHTFVNNPISSYITYKINNVEIAVEENLKKAYADITATGTASIDIELLSEEMYNKMDANADGSIDLLDIDDLVSDTNVQVDATIRTESGYSTSYNKFVTATTEYFTACQGYGHEYGDCLDECDSTTHSSHYNALEELQNTYKSTRLDANLGFSAYTNQIATLKDLYEKEMFVVQHFDEALTLKRMWFNDVTAAFTGAEEGYAKKGLADYSSEELAQLLGLNIKFDYTSANAKLGDTELMTVKNETLELKSNSTQALNGELVGDVCLTQNVAASRPILTATQKKYYTSGIAGSSWLPNERSAVNSTYYNKSAYTIPISRLNGTRVLAGKAFYSIDSSTKVGTSKTVKDNMYYDIGIDSNKNIIENVFEISSTSSFEKLYGVTQNAEVAEKQKTNASYNNGNVNSEEFNVYTPLVVSATLEQDADIIDQATITENSDIDIVQSNSSFTIRFTNNKDKVYANNSNKPNDFTSRYKQVTYIKFEFAVSNVKYVGNSGYVGTYGSAKANEWIGPIYGDYITAVPYMNTTETESKTDKSYNYYVIAVAINTEESWTRQLLAYINTSLDDLENSDLINLFKNACGNEGKNQLSYYADFQGKMMILNRIYDFRVTDLKDVDWKEVFRDNASSTAVNQHSQIAYYSGLNKWNTDNPLSVNQIVGRTTDEIGTSPTRILPLGPYKNTNTLYISAPKMGYRFSFDLKVTGAINNNKYVQITPSFYYISKDGKTFYTEYSSGNEGIYLFYKNSNGEYVRIGSSSDTYKIQFTPDDGYRALVQTGVKNLSSKVVTLGGLRKLVLKLTETTTTSQDDAAITYYGEYKLPNSTIAVRVDKNGKYDINNPLTAGYIGVVFDIRAYESDGVSLVYGKNSYKDQTNTSQWDYEGYLGISKPGENYTTTLKLEKGTWNIDNNTYNKIKGTVILYDTDSRASNDFN